MQQKKIEMMSSNLSFELKRMEIIHDNPHPLVEEAHRHDYYTLIFVEKAKGIHKIDFDEYEMGEHQVFFVAPGQVHQVIEEGRSTGFVLLFSEDFLLKHHINENFIKDLNLFRDYGQTPPLYLSEQLFSEMKMIIEEIEKLLESEMELKLDAIGAYLKLFLIKCHNTCDLKLESQEKNQNAGVTMLRDFKELVEKYYRTEHKVIFYSSKLFVSSDHLNKTVKSLIGVSAKDYIQNRIIMEAKRMLLHTDSSSKEIGYELGFKDPAHFSTFFKNCTNESVSSFKKQA